MNEWKGPQPKKKLRKYANPVAAADTPSISMIMTGYTGPWHAPSNHMLMVQWNQLSTELYEVTKLGVSQKEEIWPIWRAPGRMKKVPPHNSHTASTVRFAQITVKVEYGGTLFFPQNRPQIPRPTGGTQILMLAYIMTKWALPTYACTMCRFAPDTYCAGPLVCGLCVLVEIHWLEFWQNVSQRNKKLGPTIFWNPLTPPIWEIGKHDKNISI